MHLLPHACGDPNSTRGRRTLNGTLAGHTAFGSVAEKRCHEHLRPQRRHRIDALVRSFTRPGAVVVVATVVFRGGGELAEALTDGIVVSATTALSVESESVRAPPEHAVMPPKKKESPMPPPDLQQQFSSVPQRLPPHVAPPALMICVTLAVSLCQSLCLWLLLSMCGIQPICLLHCEWWCRICARLTHAHGLLR